MEQDQNGRQLAGLALFAQQRYIAVQAGFVGLTLQQAPVGVDHKVDVVMQQEFVDVVARLDGKLEVLRGPQREHRRRARRWVLLAFQLQIPRFLAQIQQQFFRRWRRLGGCPVLAFPVLAFFAKPLQQVIRFWRLPGGCPLLIGGCPRLIALLIGGCPVLIAVLIDGCPVLNARAVYFQRQLLFR